MSADAVSAKSEWFAIKNKREIYITRPNIVDYIGCVCVCFTTKTYSTINKQADFPIELHPYRFLKLHYSNNQK